MGYPITDRALREMTRDELGANPLCHQVVRKAQARGAITREVATLTGTIMGTFSARNHSELGWVEHHSHQDLAYFPNDEHGMDRYADWSSVSQARLLVTVTKAGRAGSKMAITADGISFAGGLSVPLDSLGVQISPWKDVSLQDGPEALTHWIVENPGPGVSGGSDPPGGIDFFEPAPATVYIESL